MDLPQPPSDLELCNIIDKLATFVARNGRQFEDMTKQKQQNNPKFAFLFGGEFFNYYQYRLTTEQAIINKQRQQQAPQMPSTGPPNWNPPPQLQQGPPASGFGPPPPGFRPGFGPPPANFPPGPDFFPGPFPRPIPGQPPAGQGPPQMPHPPPMGMPPPNLMQLEQQVTQLREELAKQENLHNDQIAGSEKNLAAQYDSLIGNKEKRIEDLVRRLREEKLTTITQHCGISMEGCKQVMDPIVDSCTKDRISNGKNWLLQVSVDPRGCDFAARYLSDRITKPSATFMERLHLIYLVNDVLHHSHRKSLDNLHAAFSAIVVGAFSYAKLQGKNDSERNRFDKLLSIWERHKYVDEAKIKKMKNTPDEAFKTFQLERRSEFQERVEQLAQSLEQQYEALKRQNEEYKNHLRNQTKPLKEQLAAMEAQLEASKPALVPPMFDPSVPPPNFAQVTRFPPPGPTGDATVPVLPDLSKPPPGFPPKEDTGIVPTVPYYDLPGGLMQPLVLMEDFEYKSINPKHIRLPPAEPPSDRLLASVEVFYAPPSHERPRDSEGWEKLALYEYYRAKQQAQANKVISQVKQNVGRRAVFALNNTSETSSPAGDRRRTERRRSDSYSSRSRSRSRSHSRSRSRSSRSRSRSRSRSHTRSRSKSSSSRSRSPPRRTRSNSRSSSRSPPVRGLVPYKDAVGSRSPTPKNLNNGGTDEQHSLPSRGSGVDMRLADDNRGHKMLEKMGWGGGGLGQKEQGRTDPVEMAEVRGKSDMFKGLGSAKNDPFEEFRKQRSGQYVERIKRKECKS